jgi:hypothetical protein
MRVVEVIRDRNRLLIPLSPTVTLIAADQQDRDTTWVKRKKYTNGSCVKAVVRESRRLMLCWVSDTESIRT